jgi:hypothetical protein
MVKSIKTFQALLSCSYDANFNGLTLTEMGRLHREIYYLQPKLCVLSHAKASQIMTIIIVGKVMKRESET